MSCQVPIAVVSINNSIADNSFIYRVLNNYFKQYLCYKEKGQVFVFVNLYAYRTTTYANEGNVTHTFAENPNTTVINPKKGTDTNYMIILVNLTQKAVSMPF